MLNAECFKWVKMVNFVMCEFYHDKNEIKVLLKRNRMAGCGGSRPWSQHFGRLRRAEHEVRSLRPAWPTRWNPISTKINTKISLAWWHVLVIPATQEKEAGESPEPGRQRLQWAERHCTPAWETRVKFCLKKIFFKVYLFNVQFSSF